MQNSGTPEQNPWRDRTPENALYWRHVKFWMPPESQPHHAPTEGRQDGIEIPSVVTPFAVIKKAN